MVKTKVGSPSKGAAIHHHHHHPSHNHRSSGLSSNIRNHCDFVSLLTKEGTTRARRRALLQLAKTPHVKAVCELVLNVLQGNVKVSPTVANKLRRNSKQCQQLLSSKTSIAKKKQLIEGNQVGGILPLLFKFGLPIATSLISSMLPKRR